MVTRKFAHRFAAEWISAWNSHDLERILSHYDEAFLVSSPLIAEITGEPSGKLCGKAAIGKYWAVALKLVPNLRFELNEVLAGVDSVIVRYRCYGSPIAEVFRFTPAGKVLSAAAHYL